MTLLFSESCFSWQLCSMPKIRTKPEYGILQCRRVEQRTVDTFVRAPGNDIRHFFSPSSFSRLLIHVISCSLKDLNSFHRWETALIMIMHPRTRYDNSGSRNIGSLFHRFWSERTANGLVPNREIHMFHERQGLARSNTGREATRTSQKDFRQPRRRRTGCGLLTRRNPGGQRVAKVKWYVRTSRPMVIFRCRVPTLKWETKRNTGFHMLCSCSTSPSNSERETPAVVVHMAPSRNQNGLNCRTYDSHCADTAGRTSLGTGHTDRTVVGDSALRRFSGASECTRRTQVKLWWFWSLLPLPRAWRTI